MRSFVPASFSASIVLALVATSCLPAPVPQKPTGRAWTRSQRPGGACALDTAPAEPAGIAPPADPGTSDLVFEIHPERPIGAISPYIYGTNGVMDLVHTRQTIVRSGGNRMTAYNWENNASNAGSDYHFQSDGWLSPSNAPAAAVLPIVHAARQNGAAAVVTVPIVDYVAADKHGCAAGCDVRSSGSDYLKTRFRQNRAVKGAPFSPAPDLSDDFVYQDEFVAFLTKAEPGAHIVYSLDNEPDLWASTHAEIHPNPVTYDEVVDKDIEFAKAIKAVAPQAEILGFVSYGWNGYLSLQDAPDKSKGDFVEYYLNKLHQAEIDGGKRLVDYLDLHWYPEAMGDGQRITMDTSTHRAKPEALIEARMQAPRSLWDATYREDSWISDKFGAIRLIPRILEKIAVHYPGTKLAFTEWNYGGGDEISGALASADVFGIFGCRGVSLAANWPTSHESFMLAALRAYRNYDGRGSTFGDTAVYAKTSNYVASSVYASTDSAHSGTLVAVALNKRAEPAITNVRIWSTAAYSRMTPFVLTGDKAELLPANELASVGTNAFRFTLPALSVAVLVFQRAR